MDFGDQYRGIRVVILGASGFIGRWVARKLYTAGACTYLVVRDSAHAAGVFARYGVPGELVEADLLDIGLLRKIYGEILPAITFNLAGYGVDTSERDEEMGYRVNAEFPKTVCEVVAANKDPSWGGQHLVHTGSALEYGESAGSLYEDGPTRPTTAYGKSKLRGTQMVAETCAALELRGLTARLFTVYGPGEHSGRLLPCLLEASRTRQPLNLTAGTQRRDFTYVEDVAEGLVRLGLATKAVPGTVVNLATSELTSVRSFVDLAAAILNLPSAHLRFGALPPRPEEMQHDAVSIDRLRGLTGWAPLTKIEAGIRKTLLITGSME
jgi:nucleoside-diphosphate-sugar epimerase